MAGVFLHVHTRLPNGAGSSFVRNAKIFTHEKTMGDNCPSSPPFNIITSNMAPASLIDLVAALPTGDGWGPPVSSETMLGGVPYAPYSKADKLGRMADWTEGKDRDRGGRQQYGNRNYRGTIPWTLGLNSRI